MTRTDAHTLDLAQQLGEALLARGWRLGTAESCTGGGLAAAVTDIAGSSAWFDAGWVSYSNASKQELLGVSPDLVRVHGAVSEAVVRAMTEGVLARRPVDAAVAITGIAGPGGASPDKPVGLVWFAWALRAGGVDSQRCQFPGDRLAIREAAVVFALQGLLARLGLRA